jgi:hypothetical protein
MLDGEICVMEQENVDVKKMRSTTRLKFVLDERTCMVRWQVLHLLHFRQAPSRIEKTHVFSRDLAPNRISSLNDVTKCSVSCHCPLTQPLLPVEDEGAVTSGCHSLFSKKSRLPGSSAAASSFYHDQVAILSQHVQHTTSRIRSDVQAFSARAVAVPVPEGQKRQN